MWGRNKQGKPKKTLIAWEEITRPRAEGGLDIRPFAEQALALKMRHVSDFGKTWINHYFIKEALRVGPQKKETKHWEAEEGILLCNNLQITNSLTMKGLLKGWNDDVKKLTFTFGDDTIPRDASME